MATRLYLHAASGAITNGLLPSGELSASSANWTASTAATIKLMNSTIGTAQTSVSGTSVASTSAQSGFLGMWRSPPLTPGQTINPVSLTVNIADAESNLSMNFYANAYNVYLYNVFTGTLTALYDGAATAQGGTEATAINSEQVTKYTGSGGTSKVSVNGDCIVFELWARHTQAAATAYTGTIYFDGTTVNTTENAVVSNHASYIEFTGTYTFQNDPVIRPITNNAGTGEVGSVIEENQQPVSGVVATGTVDDVYIGLEIKGEEATTSVGDIADIFNDEVLSSATGTAQVGDLLEANGQPLTGNEVTAQAGDVDVVNAESLLGNEATGVAGSTLEANGQPLSSVTGTGAVNTLYLGIDIYGNEATSDIGDIAPAGGTYPAAITGEVATSAIGSVVQSKEAFPLSATGTGGTGTLGKFVVLNALIGNQAIGVAGDILEDDRIAISGVFATSSVGSVVFSFIQPLAGVYGTGELASFEDLVDTGSLYKQALREAYASAPTDVVIIHTLEFKHPSFIDDSGQPTALRVVRDYVELNAYLEATASVNGGELVTFTPYAFDFQLPEVSGSAAPEISITIDNVSRLIEENLERAVLSPYPVEVTYRPYLSTDLSGPQMNPPLTMIIKSVETNDLSVTARAGFPDLANKKFPAYDYTPTVFPGLIR